MTIRHIYPCKQSPLHILFKPTSIRGQKPGFPKLTRSLKSIDPELTEDGRLLIIYDDPGDGTYKAYEQLGPDGRSPIYWNSVNSEFAGYLSAWNKKKLDLLIERGWSRGYWDYSKNDILFGARTRYFGSDVNNNLFYWHVDRPDRWPYLPARDASKELYPVGDLSLETEIEKLDLLSPIWVNSDSFNFDNIIVLTNWDECSKKPSSSVEYTYTFIHKPPTDLKNQIKKFNDEQSETVSIIGSGYVNNYNLSFEPKNENLIEILETKLFADFSYQIIGINIINSGNNYSYANIIFPLDSRGQSARASVAISSGSINSINILDEGLYSFIPKLKIIGDGGGASAEVVWKANIVNIKIEETGLYKGLTNPIFDIKLVDQTTNETYENFTFVPSGCQSLISGIELTESSSGWTAAEWNQAYDTFASIYIKNKNNTDIYIGSLRPLLKPNYPKLIALPDNRFCADGIDWFLLNNKQLFCDICDENYVSIPKDQDPLPHPLVTLFYLNSGIFNVPDLDIIYINSIPNSGAKINVSPGLNPNFDDDFTISLSTIGSMRYTNPIIITELRRFPFLIQGGVSYANNTHWIQNSSLYKWSFLISCDQFPNVVGIFPERIGTLYSPPLPLQQASPASDWRKLDGMNIQFVKENSDYFVKNNKLYSFYHTFRTDVGSVYVPSSLRAIERCYPYTTNTSQVFVDDNIASDLNTVYECPLSTDNLIHKTNGTHMIVGNKLYETTLFGTTPISFDMPINSNSFMINDRRTMTGGATAIFDPVKHSIRGLPHGATISISGTKSLESLEIIEPGCLVFFTGTYSRIERGDIFNYGPPNCDDYDEAPWSVQRCSDWVEYWIGGEWVSFCNTDYVTLPGFGMCFFPRTLDFDVSIYGDAFPGGNKSLVELEPLAKEGPLADADINFKTNATLLDTRLGGVSVGISSLDRKAPPLYDGGSVCSEERGYKNSYGYTWQYYCVATQSLSSQEYWPPKYWQLHTYYPSCACDELYLDDFGNWQSRGKISLNPVISARYEYNPAEIEILNGRYRNFQIPNFMVDIDYLENNISKYDIAGIPSYSIPKNRLDNKINGKLISVALENNGYGYREVPRIHIGGNAQVTGIIQGYVESIEIINGGLGYSGSPTISFVGDGIPPIVGDVRVKNGKIISVNIINGGKYRETPTIELLNEKFINNSGVSAYLKPIMNYSVIDIQIKNSGSMYQYAPDIVIESPYNDNSYTQLMNRTITRAEYDTLPQVARAQCSISGSLTTIPSVSTVVAHGGKPVIGIDSKLFDITKIKIDRVKILDVGYGYNPSDTIYVWAKSPAGTIYFDGQLREYWDEYSIATITFNGSGEISEFDYDPDLDRLTFSVPPTIITDTPSTQPIRPFSLQLVTENIQSVTFFKRPSLAINEIEISIAPAELFDLKKTAIFLEKTELDTVRNNPIFNNDGIVDKSLGNPNILEPPLYDIKSDQFKAYKLKDLRFGFTNAVGYYWSEIQEQYIKNLSYDNINNPFYYNGQVFYLPDIRWKNFKAEIFDIKGIGATINADLVDDKVNRMYFTSQGNELYTEDAVISISGNILFEPAILIPVIDINNNSGIKNIIIENEGYGYIANNSEVTIDHNTGSGLSIKIDYYNSVIPSGIAAIRIVDSGSNYSEPPVITIKNRNNTYINNLIRNINIQLRNFRGSLSYPNIGGILSYNSFCIEYTIPISSKASDIQFPYIEAIDCRDKSIFSYAYRHKGVKSINMFYDTYGPSFLNSLTFDSPPTINSISSITNNPLKSPTTNLGYNPASGVNLPTKFIEVSGSCHILYNY